MDINDDVPGSICVDEAVLQPLPHKEEEEEEESKAKSLLKTWNLAQYAKILIVDGGYEEVDDLKGLGFKEGHSKKFVRKVCAHFEEREGVMEGKKETMPGDTSAYEETAGFTNDG